MIANYLLVQDEMWNVQVCEPALSEEILDLNNVSSGEFSVQKV